MLVEGIFLAILTCVRATTSTVDFLVGRPSLFGILKTAEINSIRVGRAPLVIILEAQMVLRLLFLLLLEVCPLPLVDAELRPTRTHHVYPRRRGRCSETHTAGGLPEVWYTRQSGGLFGDQTTQALGRDL